MNFSNAFVDFSEGFLTYPLPLFRLLCFFSFPLFEFANDATKLSPISQNMRGKKRFLQYLPGGRNFSGLRVIAKVVR